MADIYVPDDLRDTSQPDTDKNYFKIVIPDLNPGEIYPIQFRWQYEDKTYSDWSASKSFTTASEVPLNAPQFLSGDLSADGATLVIKWSGFDSAGNAYPSNLDRVDIYIKGGIYGESYVKAGDSFKSTGTKVISVGTGATYFVKLRAVSKSGIESSFSTERSATTVANLTADVTAPAAPSTGTVTAGIDNSTGATIGFNAFLDISWSAVSDSTLRGYRIRFRKNGSSDPYSYVDSPGTGTTFRLNGLAIGTTYEVSIASYDELNNTSSSYTSIGTATATGTPFIGKNVTTEGYFGASATGDTGTFKFGYGVETGKRGLVFNANNYWYIDSSSSALFKLGGASSNFVSWNGTKLSIDGDLGVAGGTTIGGNIAMTATGASIYNGTLDGTGALTGTGFILNKDGLQFKVLGSPTITLASSTGAITATNATITGTFKTAASGTRVQMSSSSQTNYIYLYSGTVSSSISGESDGLYIKGADATDNHVVFYGPAGAFANGTSFGSQVKIVPVSTDTSATVGEFRLRNMTTGTTAPSTSTGGAGTSGGYGSLFLVYT